MSYNQNNKNAVILALTFAVMMTMSGAAYAEDAAPFLFDEPEVSEQAPQAAEDAAKENELLPSQEEQAADVATEKPAFDTSFLDEQIAEEAAAEAEQPLAEVAESESDSLFGDEPITDENTAEGEVLGAPQSPFENFGNAILSKVDNDLFNQMSQIEKQTTLLNLELKREDVRNKVEALKEARVLARQQAEARRLAEEEKLKDMEAARQAKIMAAEEQLREKEIELEKVRQAKVLNDYMNEMLIMNQKWIEKNGSLQNRIKELEDERKTLIATFEDKVALLQSKANSVNAHANEAAQKYEDAMKTMNTQIIQLRKDLVDSETRMQQMREQAATNPFGPQGNLDPNAASVDLAQEYAIMDITGQGDDIVAKIVSRDGTTFTVHRGSVLRGGETVLKITEKYIAFDKKGMKAYLYPGGTIMEYEPTNIFNEAEKTPESTEKQSFRPEQPAAVANPASNAEAPAPSAFGKPMNQERIDPKKQTEVVNKPKRTNSLSFSQGMFAK